MQNVASGQSLSHLNVTDTYFSFYFRSKHF